MRTTVDLPETLFREAKARAALAGITLKELLTRFIENGLRDMDDSSHQDRMELPPVIPDVPGRRIELRSNAEIQAIFDAEDLAALKPE